MSKQKENRTSKLQLFSTPLVEETDVLLGTKEVTNNDDTDSASNEAVHRDDGYPNFKRYEDPTLLEIFFDLFFAATYNAFCDTKQVTSHATFKASIGFFCLLWLTWLSIALFDVRYATDSMFSRTTTAIQLGVLIGFVVLAPSFDPSEQKVHVMRAMSIILAFSRLVLCIQYAWITWHLRSFKKVRTPMYIQIAIHAVSALVYLGVTFRFQENESSKVFVVWYVISGLEGSASMILSHTSPAVALQDTHLMKRMALLTVMILGEAIEAIAKKVVVITQAPGSFWSPATIGHVSAAAATVFIVFLVYFDWLGGSFHLPAIRQTIWITLHLPFHLALVLFMQAFSQYIIWSKIVTEIGRALAVADPFMNNINVADGTTSEEIANAMNQSISKLFVDYPPKVSGTLDTVNSALKNISSIPNLFWPTVDEIPDTINELKDMPLVVQKWFPNLVNACSSLAVSLSNAIFGTFGINLAGEIVAKNPKAAEDVKSGGLQFEIAEQNWSRFQLVFAYGYIACGCTILFVLILRLVSCRIPHKVWPIARLIIVFALSLGVALTSLLWFNQDKISEYLGSPWVLPTITLVWAVILILTHIRGDGTKLHRALLKRRRRTLEEA